jgi:hypothetical protein
MPERDDAEFLSIARERFARAYTEEHDIRTDAEEDLRYVAGEQWPDRDLQERKSAGRPALVFNKLPAHVQQVANEARQNKPQIKFSPVDDGADKDTATVLEGLARHIQYASDADVAYETALDYSASCGFGYFRFVTDYCDDSSFDQELKIETVPDPFRVYGVMIPAILNQKTRFAFVVDTITKDEFKARFPGVEPAELGFDCSHINQWVLGDRIQIAEYWYVETKRKPVYLISNGQHQMSSSTIPDGWEVVKERSVMQDVVKSCVIDGTQILPDTETEWPGCTIPIVAVLGKSIIIDGKPRLFSLIRHAKNPQFLLNVSKSRIAETLGLSPISPWIAQAGQIENYSEEWVQAHKKPVAVLRYDGVSVAGTPAPPPQRQVYEPPINALTGFVMQETQDIKESTSIYDSSLGDRSNETSGVAINRRQRQSALSNFHFIDNLSRAHRTGGRIIAEVVPVIMDTARIVRIIGEDEQPRIIRVNELWKDPETGKTHNYNLTTGKYDVTVTTGPGYTTKRQESFELLTQMAQAYPQLVAIGGDVIFENSDIPGADRIAKRIKKQIPQELLDDDEKAQDGQKPGQPSPAEISQIMQQHDLLTQQVTQLQQVIDSKQVEIDSRERIESGKRDIEREKIAATSEVELAKLGSSADMENLRHIVSAIMLEREMSDRQQSRDESARQAEVQRNSEQQQMPEAA